MCSRCGRGRARRAARSHRGPTPVGLLRDEGGRAKSLPPSRCREGKKVSCKPALQQIENAHRKGMPEGLRDWERGGLLEAIAYYRSKLEAVVFMWVPAHVGIACNAYADAVATAYLGNNDTEDASKVVRDAVRTRPCMYTASEKRGGKGHREEGDSGPTDVWAHASERARVGV